MEVACNSGHFMGTACLQTRSRKEIVPTRLKVNVKVRFVSQGIAHCPPNKISSLRLRTKNKWWSYWSQPGGHRRQSRTFFQPEKIIKVTNRVAHNRTSRLGKGRKYRQCLYDRMRGPTKGTATNCSHVKQRNGTIRIRLRVCWLEHKRLRPYLRARE